MAKKKSLDSKASEPTSSNSSEAIEYTTYTLNDMGMPIPLSPGDPRRSGFPTRRVPKRKYHPRDYDDLTPDQVAQLDPNNLPWGL